MDGKTLIVLLGPTGVGKTDLALQLAESLGTCILNADSRQIFSELQIGTASPTPRQLQRVKHHFVGTLHLNNYYSAAKYEQDALQLLQKIFEEKAVAILSGGSMLYVDAVCNGIDDIPTIDAETRAFVREHYESHGLEALVSELRLLDPEYYAVVDRKNTQRIIHALEICYMTHRPYSSFRTRHKKARPFRILKIGLQRERAELFDRINRRVDLMMQNGLLNEARRLYPQRALNALNTVGYKELFSFFDGQYTLEQAVEKIKRNTRVYAKKQMTWYKHDASIHWFHPDQGKEIAQLICSETALENSNSLFL